MSALNIVTDKKGSLVELQISEPLEQVKWKKWKCNWTDRLPQFTLIIAITQVLSFILEDEEVLKLFSFTPNKRHESWRLISYSLIHRDLYHLLPNVIVFCIVSSHFELYSGIWKTSIIYFTGVVAGALGFDMFERRRRLMGSSAGCSSLIFANTLEIILMKWRKKGKRDPLVFKDFLCYRLIVLACFAVTMNRVPWTVTSRTKTIQYSPCPSRV